VSEEVPADVARLLQEQIGGYEHLQTLRVFFRNRSEAWTPARIAGVLNVSEELAANTLAELAHGGLIRVEYVEHEPAYTYPATDASIAETVERLMVLYEANPIAVMRLVNANAIERVRRGAGRAFADAFVLGRKKRDG
jgi:hypothetical protein